MRELFRRLRYLLNRRRFDEELKSDMEFHREMSARDKEFGRGNFGNTLRLREDAREAWGWMWIDRLMQDLRFATRMLMKAPGFTLTAVLVLAIGIGVNVTAFSLFNLAVLKPLPVRDPDSIVRLQRRSPENIAAETPYLSMIFYREHSRTLSAVMAMTDGRLKLDDDVQPVTASFVTANYFTELGTSAAYGRLLDPERDETANAASGVVLSYRFWQRRFGADPSIVGRTVHLNRRTATVIGVTPYAFGTLDGSYPDIFLPVTQQPYFVKGSKVLNDMTSGGGVRMWGRVVPGVTVNVAEQELLALTDDLRKQYPKLIWDHEYIKSDPGGHLRVLQPEMYPALAMVGALVLLILVVSCTNLGGLLLARGVTREREIRIRMAIGASKKRVFRQLFTESLLLALLGSASGLTLSYAILRAALALADAPSWMSAAPDLRVLTFAAGMGFIAAVFFGLTPAWQIVRQQHRKPFVRQMLVGTQVAASCVLLIAAALLDRAVQHALYTDPGFGYEQVLSIEPQLADHGYTGPAARAYLEDLKSRLRAIPGVTSVALCKMPPLNDTISYTSINIEGRPVIVYPNWVDPEFFQTMNIPLLRGRTLAQGEPNAVIVSESLARKLWPGKDPLGQPFPADSPNKKTVVGVAGNARVNAMNDGDSVEMYEAAPTADMAAMVVLLKTAGAPDNLVPMVKSISETIDPRLFPEIRVLKAAFQKNMQPVEQAAIVVSSMGMIAVVLAGIGLVGLVSYAVSQRTKEIAIRMAVGANRGQVLATILGQFAWPLVLGLVVGTGIAAGLSQVLRRILYGVSSLDALSYAGAIGVLVAIIAVAALAPGRQALRLDLARALHDD